MDEQEGENEDLHTKSKEQAKVITPREDKKEDLAKEVEVLRLDIDMHHCRNTESIEHSQSSAQILDKR